MALPFSRSIEKFCGLMALPSSSRPCGWTLKWTQPVECKTKLTAMPLNPVMSSTTVPKTFNGSTAGAVSTTPPVNLSGDAQMPSTGRLVFLFSATGWKKYVSLRSISMCSMVTIPLCPVALSVTLQFSFIIILVVVIFRPSKQSWHGLFLNNVLAVTLRKNNQRRVDDEILHLRRERKLTITLNDLLWTLFHNSPQKNALVT